MSILEDDELAVSIGPSAGVVLGDSRVVIDWRIDPADRRKLSP